MHSYYVRLLEKKFDHLIGEPLEDASQIHELVEMGEWDFISEYLSLSAQFIETHHEKLNWALVSMFQFVPDDLIVKFIDKVDIVNIINAQEDMRENSIRKDVTELIYQKMYQKFESESTQQPNRGPFEHDAKRLYDFVLEDRNRHPEPEKFERRVQKRIRVQKRAITVEDVCEDIKLCDDFDGFWDLAAFLAENCYLNSTAVLRYFEMTPRVWK